jgi:hypothetical protein
LLIAGAADVRSSFSPVPGAEGCSEAVMIANGIDVDTMVQIIVEGLATATPQRTRPGREVLEVAVLRISEKGRRALALEK